MNNDMIGIPIEEYSDIYEISIETLHRNLQEGILPGRSTIGIETIALQRDVYEIDKIEQPEMKAKIRAIKARSGTWVTVSSYLFVLINLASIALLALMIFWHEFELAFLIPVVVTLPAWLYVISIQTSGKTQRWQINVLGRIAPFMRIGSWILAAAIIVVIGLKVYEMFNDMNLKTIGIIIIMLLVAVIFNQIRINSSK